MALLTRHLKAPIPKGYSLSSLIIPLLCVIFLWEINTLVPSKYFIPAMVLAGVVSFVAIYCIVAGVPVSLIVSSMYLCGIHFIAFNIYTDMGLITSSGILSIMLFAFIVIETVRKGSFQGLTIPHVYLFLAFLAISGASVFISLMHGNLWTNALREFSAYPSIFVMAAFIMVFMDDRLFIRNLILLMIIGSLIAGVGFLEYVTSSKSEQYFEYRTRVGSVFGSPNALAAYLELLFPLTFAFMLMPLRTLKLKLLLASALLMQVAGALLTFSRGAFAGLIIASGIVIFTGIRSRAKKMMLAGAVACMLLAASTATLLQRQFNIFNVDALASQDLSTLGRVGQVLTGIRIIADNPWWGVGFGGKSTSGIFPHFFPSDKVVYFFGHLNNMYLDVATKSGLPAAALFISFIVAGLVTGYRRIRNTARTDSYYYVSIGLFAGLATVSLHLFFDGMVKWPPMNYLFGFVWGLYYYAIEKLRTDKTTEPVRSAAA